MSTIAPNTQARGDIAGIPRWVNVSILTGVTLFVLALLGSAILIPQLRILHSLQALIYVAVILLTRRNSPWGFGVAVFISTAWNCLNLFVTHLFITGALLVWSFIRTGQISRPDTMLVFIASLAHFLLIAACMAGFLRLQPGKRQWYRFIGGGLLVLGYMALIIVIAAPR